MSNNPFHQQPTNAGNRYYDWQQLFTKPISYKASQPSTRLMAILCQALEQYSIDAIDDAMTIDNNDLRRQLSILSRTELQQQIRLACLKPADISALQYAIDMENANIQLTTSMYLVENDKYVKQAMEFALLEHYDHIYRLSNLLDMDYSIDASSIVGDNIEIMPARPTISQHRHPHDDIKRYTNYKQSKLSTIIHITILQALAKYSRRYYLDMLAYYPNILGRHLMGELTHIKHQHVNMYNSLADINITPVERLLIAQYTECYAYLSAYKTEQDKRMSHIWEEHYDQELYHLHTVADMLTQHQGKTWQQILSNGDYPEPITLADTKEHIRKIMNTTINNTSVHENFTDCSKLDNESNFAYYQEQLNHHDKLVPSHNVLCKQIADNKSDYRHQVACHPIETLDNRHKDNISIGR